MVLNFNPRSRVGSDMKANLDVAEAQLFQSTLPRGERLGANKACVACKVFQSTLPRGERLVMLLLTGSICHFNPRSRVGSDQELVKWYKDLEISIHAPAWGATAA